MNQWKYVCPRIVQYELASHQSPISQSSQQLEASKIYIIGAFAEL